MRNGTQKAREHTIARVDGYHHGDYENYCVFASDRPLKTNEYYTFFDDGKSVEKALFGFEVETQNWGITDQTIYANVLRDICFAPFHKDLWKIERDGSLVHGCDSSAECITQPMTKAYIRNHYRDFRYMWEKFGSLGVSADKTGCCGMHTHINKFCFGRDKKTQDEAIRKFLYIINKHYDLMVYLFYRNPSVTGYCPKMHKMTNKEYVKNVSLAYFNDDHYVCINMGHYNQGHIELRLVGGQKNYACFRNTVESVFHIIEACKSVSWSNLDDITKIFSGCNQYVFDRLKTYCFENGKITMEQLEEIKPTVIREELL